MRRIHEILRQKFELGRSHREVARSLGVSVGGVAKALRRLQNSGLNWPEASKLDHEELERKLYGSVASESDRPRPDCAEIHLELQRAGVTLQLLHLEYLEQYPGGYQYTQFCEYYRRWRKKRNISMRQLHKNGEKFFIDYAGDKPSIVNHRTGELVEVELFVATMGASNFIYAEATMTQRGPDWIASHVRALEYLGGVPEVLVCDQLKSGVIKACRYEPGLQRTYDELARHYGTTIIPARPRSPKDKSKVEVSVQVAERWILARLRNEIFFSLCELNQRIAELLEDVNSRVMKRYEATRFELFERYDKPCLKALPAEPFVFCLWKKARVNIDYHVIYEKHCYSVPYALTGQEVEIRATEHTLEIFRKNTRVASHRRSMSKGGFTTDAEHMPAAHRKHLEWTPSRLVDWGATIGPDTKNYVEAILADKPHPEQGYRACLGLLRLAKQYGEARLETACGRALKLGVRNYRFVANMLRSGLDQTDSTVQQELPLRPTHEHVRGAAYYNPND